MNLEMKAHLTFTHNSFQITSFDAYELLIPFSYEQGESMNI